VQDEGLVDSDVTPFITRGRLPTSTRVPLQLYTITHNLLCTVSLLNAAARLIGSGGLLQLAVGCNGGGVS